MVLQFPTSRNGWKLDAVGLLAVIGETTTETCVEPMTASYLCLLPRLIPAPQALIRPNRRISLPRVDASVIGVFSGNKVAQLSYIANQFTPIGNMHPFSVSVYCIKHRERSMASVDVEAPKNQLPGESGPPVPALRRRVTNVEKLKAHVTLPEPIMKAKTYSPHNILSIATTLLTIGLIVWAIVIEDGPAAIAIVLLSFATTLFCAASLWSPPIRSNTQYLAYIPQGDVVIQIKQGAFIVVKCDETVSRELYFGSENIRQVITTGFGSSVGVGTVVFMVAVIMMGNCSWTMQAALAATYLLLNAIYWFVALMPSRIHWDFPLYDVREIFPTEGRNSRFRSYTEALWLAMLESGSIGWVKASGAIPSTPAWERWLREAEDNITSGNRDWNPIEAKGRIIKEEEAKGVEAARKEDAKVEDAKVEDAKVEAARKEDAKVEDAKVEDAKVEDAKEEDAKVEIAKVEDANNPDAKRKNTPSEASYRAPS